MRISSAAVAAVAILSSPAALTAEAKGGRRRALLAKLIKEQPHNSPQVRTLKKKAPDESANIKKEERDAPRPLWEQEEEGTPESPTSNEEEHAPDVGILTGGRSLQEWFETCPPSHELLSEHVCDCRDFNSATGTGSWTCVAIGDDGATSEYSMDIQGPNDYVYDGTASRGDDSWGYFLRVDNGEIDSCKVFLDGCECECVVGNCPGYTGSDYGIGTNCPGVGWIDFCGEDENDWFALEATCSGDILSGGAIAGIVVAILAVLGCAAGLVTWFLCRNRVEGSGGGGRKSSKNPTAATDTTKKQVGQVPAHTAVTPTPTPQRLSNVEEEIETVEYHLDGKKVVTKTTVHPDGSKTVTVTEHSSDGA